MISHVFFEPADLIAGTTIHKIRRIYVVGEYIYPPAPLVSEYPIMGLQTDKGLYLISDLNAVEFKNLADKWEPQTLNVRVIGAPRNVSFIVFEIES